MSATTSERPGASSATPPPPPDETSNAGGRWFGLGVANLVVVVVLAIASWWLLSDPKWSPWSFYPLPFNAALFWGIIFIVYVGFNCEFAGLDRFAQPLRGLLIVVLTAVFGVGMTVLLGLGLGNLFPDFAIGRPMGTGYFAGALFVLFAFFVYVCVVLNWGHWPWVAIGMKQPLVGLCEIAFCLAPTLALYLIFGLPSVSVATPPGNAILTINVVLGFFYSMVVATIVTGLTAENWPWSLAGTGGRMALVSLIGNVALAFGVYFGLLGICKAIIGSTTTAALGDVIHQFPSQLGVCWAFWMIFWANGFGNWPNGPSRARNIAARVVITLGLGIATFALYYYWLAQHVLHEPVVAGSLHGNALGFMDWLVLWTLFYVVGFGSYGLPKPPEPAEATPVPEHVEPVELIERADHRMPVGEAEREPAHRAPHAPA